MLDCWWTRLSLAGESVFGRQRTRLPVQETQKMGIQPLGQEDLLEEGMATHSRILAWRIPWTEEPGKESDTAEVT